MEIINKYLEENEELIWKYHYNYDDNLMDEILYGFYLSIVIILTGIITPLFFIVENPKSLIFNMIIMLFLSGFGLNVGILSYLRMVRRCKTTHLTPSGLKHYKNVFICTNKRWIQRSYRNNIKINKSYIKNKILEKKDDLIFVNLNTIKAVIVEELTYYRGKIEKNGAIVKFFLNSSYQYPYKSNLRVNIDNRESYQDLLKELSEIIL